jgi:HSP20 family protein
MNQDDSFEKWMQEFMNKVFTMFPELERVVNGEEFREVVERLESGLPAAFYIKIGPNGPEIRHFDMIEDFEEDFEDEDLMFQVFEDEDQIFVSMEINEAEKEDIEVRIRGDRILEIFIAEELVKSIELPAPVKEDSVRASYKNGVLDVIIEKVEEFKFKKVKIE